MTWCPFSWGMNSKKESHLVSTHRVQRITQASRITKAARKKNNDLDFRLCGVFPEREHIFSSLASLRRQLGFPPKLLHKNPMTPAGFHEDVCKTETLCTVCYVHTLHFQTCLMSFIQLHAVALFVITSFSRIFSLNS